MRSALNKHQEKTRATEQRLLQAALRIFARDGFEAARIDDIAREAGYTRGAFYAHFSSKENLFFVLLEEQARQSLTAAKKAMLGRTTEREQMETLRDFYIGKLSDRKWSILILEFKLYALRHPKHRVSLAAAYRSVREKMKWPEELGWRDDFLCTADEPGLTRMALQIMLQGLVLERAYDPDSISETAASWLLRRTFDLLVGLEPVTASSGRRT